MNKMVLRAEEILTSYFDCDDASGLIHCIREQLDAQKKVVCSVRLNHQEISEEHESTLVNFQLSNVKMLEVEYCDYEEFYLEFIDSTQKFLLDLQKICPFISESIYEQKIDRFHQMFQDFIDSMNSLITAVHFIHYKAQKQNFSEKAWQEIENKTSTVLQQVLKLYPEKDFVSLADIFEYEMTDVLEDWSCLLQTMKADEPTRSRQT